MLDIDACRRRVRRDVKELFQSVDSDSSGLLDKTEVGRFFSKAQKLIHIDPAFDLEADWKLMISISHNSENATGVSFPVFEQWWKLRSGIGASDMPVIPEFIAERCAT